MNLKSLTKMKVATNLQTVREKVIAASARRPREYHDFEPRLVAVSKLQPIELIISAYEAGQRHFGENYVNELADKASNPQLLETCKNIKWHFIGRLQKNKVNKLSEIANLYMIETIDNEKLASALDNKIQGCDGYKLRVMVQVNTSNEKAKNGCQIEVVSQLVKYILENCPNLQFLGLMTIGRFGYDINNGQNPDFLILKQCRTTLCNDLNLQENKVEISMGMSSDYEHAIELGSTSVRVGSAIFGGRPKTAS